MNPQRVDVQASLRCADVQASLQLQVAEADDDAALHAAEVAVAACGRSAARRQLKTFAKKIFAASSFTAAFAENIACGCSVLQASCACIKEILPSTWSVSARA